MSKRWWRPARLVFLTVHEDADFARAALDAGGLGYVVNLTSSPLFWFSLVVGSFRNRFVASNIW